MKKKLPKKVIQNIMIPMKEPAIIDEKDLFYEVATYTIQHERIIMKHLSLIPIIFLIAGIVLVSGCQKSPDSSDQVDTELTSAKSSDINVKSYPLDTCIVSGSKLGEMGDPIVKVYGDREIKFCCAGCVSKFEDKQDEYVMKLDTGENMESGDDMSTHH